MAERDQAELEIVVDLAKVINALAAGNREVIDSFRRWQEAAADIDFDPSSESAQQFRNAVLQSTVDFESLSQVAVDSLRRRIPEGAQVSQVAFDELEKAFKDNQKEVEDLRRKVQNFGKSGKKAGDEADKSFDKLKSTFSRFRGLLATAGITLSLNQIVEASVRQDAANRLLEESLKGSAIASRQSAEDLADYAAALQKVTTFGDEAIQEIQALTLRYRNITEPDVLEKATRLSLDLAVALGRDLAGSAKSVAQALNDPARRISELREAGIAFTDSQVEQVKILQQSGKLYEAQGIILAQLELQFGGAAKAARDTLGGSLQSLGNVVGDLLEQVGEGGLNTALAESAKQLEEFARGSDGAAARLGDNLGTAVEVLTSLLLTVAENADFAAAGLAGVAAPSVLASLAKGRARILELTAGIRNAEGAAGKLKTLFSSGLGIGLAVAAVGTIVAALKRFQDRQASIAAEQFNLTTATDDYANRLQFLLTVAQQSDDARARNIEKLEEERRQTRATILAIEEQIDAIKRQRDANLFSPQGSGLLLGAIQNALDGSSESIERFEEKVKQLQGRLPQLRDAIGLLTDIELAAQNEALEKAGQRTRELTEAEQELIKQVKGGRLELDLRTIAFVRAREEIIKQGNVSTETALRLREIARELLDAWETAGEAVPENLQAIIDQLGILSTRQEELRDLQQATTRDLIGLSAQLREAVSADAAATADFSVRLQNQFRQVRDDLAASPLIPSQATVAALEEIRPAVVALLKQFEDVGEKPPADLARFAEAVGATADQVQADLERQAKSLTDFLRDFESGALAAEQTLKAIQDRRKAAEQELLAQQQQALAAEKENVSKSVDDLLKERQQLEAIVAGAGAGLQDLGQQVALNDAADRLRDVDSELSQLQRRRQEIAATEVNITDPRDVLTLEEVNQLIIEGEKNLAAIQQSWRGAAKEAKGAALESGRLVDGTFKIKNLADETGVRLENVGGQFKIVGGEAEAAGVKIETAADGTKRIVSNTEDAASAAADHAAAAGDAASQVGKAADAASKLSTEEKKAADEAKSIEERFREIEERQVKIDEKMKDFLKDLNSVSGPMETWAVLAERVRDALCQGAQCLAQVAS